MPLLFSSPDPVGDASGDGSYLLPSVPAAARSLYDIRSLDVQNAGGKLRLNVALSAVANPWQAPGGWSGVVLDIFVKSAPGGRMTLDDTGLSTPGSSGWQDHYRLTGFGAQHFRASAINPQGVAPALLPDKPRWAVQGTDIQLDTSLSAAGQYAYWVTASVYSPLSHSGLVQPAGAGGALELQSATTGTPAPLDVLYAGDQRPIYLSRTLPPVGQTTDYRALGLLVTAVLSLLLAMYLAYLLWKRAP